MEKTTNGNRRAHLLSWWSTTTDRRFLEAEVHFRHRWPWLLPMGGLLMMCGDFSAALARGNLTSWLWVPIDALVFLVACIATRYRDLRGTLYVDFFVTLVFITGGLILLGDGMQPKDIEGVTTCLYSPMFYPFLVVLTMFLGFHSSVLPLIFAACAVAVLRSGNMSDGVNILVVTAALMLGCIGFEHSVASLFRELHTELECNQLLLDGATDGFGMVDSQSSELVSASRKMLETFGLHDVQGQRLDTLIDTADHKGLATFFGSAGTGPAAVLVTCTSQRLQFDVRLVPYKMDGTKLGFCIQKLGESRSVAFTHNACHSELLLEEEELDMSAFDLELESAASVYKDTSAKVQNFEKARVGSGAQL
eukprot:727957-Amphidinium_carterae.1